MREILFLAHRIPYPPDRGDRMRSFHLLKALAKLAPVHLAAFADCEADRAHLATLAPLLASSHVELRSTSPVTAGIGALLRGEPVSVALYRSVGMQDWIERLLSERPVGTIFAFSGQMAQYVPDDFDGRFLMDFVDVDSAKFEAFARSAGGPMRWVYAREGRRLAAFEVAVSRRADLSLFVSDAEVALFRARGGSTKVRTLENGIDLQRYDPALGRKPVGHGKGPLIVFTGQMDYRPNIEAVACFAREALPLIRARQADAHFAIVGRDPDASVQRLAALPGVTVTGEVPDVRDWIAAAEVVVAPLRLARGVQNKVLEAMAMARPVVASPAAAEGIDVRPGEELVVADGSAAEAEAVVALLGAPELARSIGTAARARMVARYGWDARLAALPAMLGMEKAVAA